MSLSDNHSTIDPVAEEDRHRILTTFNATCVDYPKEKLIHELIAEQAGLRPDSVAIVCDDEEITYSQLACRVHSLAWSLHQDHAVGRDTLVALFMERSVEMVVGILAILEAGGAYVPIDPTCPAARIRFILQDCRANLLLTNLDVDSSLFKSTHVVDLRHHRICSSHQTAPPRESSRDSLIYCLYTSGSSGEPKGVLVEHGGVLNVLQWVCDYLRIGCDDRVLQKTTYTFDVSVTELFVPLMRGARLVLLPRGAETFPSSIRKTLLRHGVTVAQFVPSVLASYLACLDDDPLPYVQRCICVGESLKPSLRTAFYKATSQCELYNLYGPTEASIYATACLVERGDRRVTIGKPLSNTRIRIFDPHDRLCLIGVPGEICIAGIAVARGYLNRPEQTSEKFREDPFAPGERMYRTGDLGVWLENGEVQFLGRRDHQVKIRGHRLELGEVENALSLLEGVEDAAVISVEFNGQQELVAYWVGDSRLSATLLREGLGKLVPAYMLPWRFIHLESLPVTVNGKLQRAALPKPDLSCGPDTSLAAPLAAFARGLCSIIEEVLGLHHLGANDRFLDIGGDSLKAVRVAMLVRRRLGRNLEIESLLRNESIAALTSQENDDSAGALPPIEPAPVADWYPLSSGQLAQWLLAQAGVPHPAYTVSGVYELTGELDTYALRRSAELLVSRHESLRTAINELDGVPMQRVRPEYVVEWHCEAVENPHYYDLTRKLREFVKIGFDLAAGQLLRFLLIERSVSDHIFVVSMHHIASDGWSLTVLIDELLATYKSLSRERQRECSTLTPQYKDYACWQQRLLKEGAFEKSRDYWMKKLGGALERLELPSDRPRMATSTFQGASAQRTISTESLHGLKSLCHEEHTTLYSCLCTVLRILCFRYTRQEDFVLGTSALGRSVPELHDQIGYYVNTLALRDVVTPTITFRQLLHRVQNTLLEAVRHRDYPFERVIYDAGMTERGNRNPLFDVMMLVDSGWGDPTVEIPGLHIRHLDESKEYSRVDLTIVFKETANGLKVSLEYSTDIFDSDRIERMLDHFETLVTAVINTPDVSVQSLPLLCECERHCLLVDFNETEVDYRGDRLVHELFEEQVQRMPERVATIDEHRALTFAELNARANSLAWMLRTEYGVGPESLVGLFMDRSVEMMVGILGIVKAGGAYVPIDIRSPTERIDAILLDSGARVVLTNGDANEALRRDRRAILDLSSSTSFAARDDNPPLLARPDNLIYCIYTSGSTGRPKGVLIEHRAVVNRLEWMIKALDLNQTDVILQKTPNVFDVSVWELFLPGLIGARQVMLRAGGEADPEAIRDTIRDYGVSTVHFVPSMLRQYLIAFDDGFRGVKHCICSGEELGKDLAGQFFAATRRSHTKLYNYYGPTEAAVDVSFCQVKDEVGPISIGSPAPNNFLYILDASDNPCPIGVAGELCIGGVQVGRGYLNSPELTQERFTANPFRPGERMYRTGDLARWRRDGEILYLGRRDRQVKLRGFRVELSEIEQVMCTQVGVERAVVLVQRDEAGSDYLCAYMQGPSCPSANQIRGCLASRLPHYMVPSHYVQTDAIPVTRNGKVDQAALVRLDRARCDTGRFVPPRTQLETDLIGIWRALLPVDGLSVNDDFFAVGGDSLLALQLSSRMSRRFGIAIKVAAIYTHRSVAEQARMIATSPTRALQALRPCLRSRRHVLSFAQERLWFLHMLNPESTAYNIPMLARLSGPLCSWELEKALRTLVERHEMLRVRFINSDERAFQVPCSDISGLFEECDLTAMVDDEIGIRAAVRASHVRPFHLHKDPPFRATLFRLSDTDHYLLITLHHIAGDGWSLRLILRELFTLYMQHLGEPIAALPPLPLQYIDYAEAMRDPDREDVMERDLRYWLNRLATYTSLTLPEDSLVNDSERRASGQVSSKIAQPIYRNLKKLARNTETTLFEITMSALTLVLSRLSDQQDVVVGFPVANRHGVELEGVVGLFLDTLVLRTDLSGKPTFNELLRRVSTGIREAYEHQEAPFELLVERLKPARDLDDTPIFNVLLNFVGGMQDEIAIKDLSVTLEDIFEHEAKAPLAFYVQENGEGLALDLVYRANRFSAPRAEMMVRQLRFVIEQVVAEPDHPIASYSLIPAGLESILAALDRPILEPDYPLVPDLIASRALSFPARVAIAQGADSVSYAELTERSELIAQCLVRQECGPGDVVAVAGPRSIGFVAGVLGVLRSGAIVFPLDPTLPERRREQLIAIANVKMLISATSDGDCVADPKALPLPQLHVAARTGRPRLAPSELVTRSVLPSISGQSKAYLFFTSGTTGSPRGVLGRHGALSHFLLWQSQLFSITEHDRCAQLTNPSFDVMLRDTFVALISGGTLVIPEESDQSSGRAIFRWLEKERISLLHTVPTLLQYWLCDVPVGSRLPCLRWSFIAGEPLKASLIESFRSKCPDSGEIINLYGPTETTLAKFFYKVPRGPLPPVLPVGAPLPYCQGLVMRDAIPCGVGEPGEIVIRTPFRTLGYFNDPLATQAAFYPNPHRNDDQDLFYRTGDIGRFRADGLLEILGRKDQQLKISGVRIEPAEIENTLGRHPLVKACLVVPHQDPKGELHLVAYVVADAQDPSLANRLRAYLAALLPIPMVPREYIFIDEIPTTPSGKQDRKALPTPGFTRVELRMPDEAPRSAVERDIREAWQVIFDCSKIGVRDNFFEIGGTSLQLLRLFALLDTRYPNTFRVAQLFTNPTIATQAALVDSSYLDLSISEDDIEL